MKIYSQNRICTYTGDLDELDSIFNIKIRPNADLVVPVTTLGDTTTYAFLNKEDDPTINKGFYTSVIYYKPHGLFGDDNIIFTTVGTRKERVREIIDMIDDALGVPTRDIPIEEGVRLGSVLNDSYIQSIFGLE